VSKLDVRYRVRSAGGGTAADAKACGPGCYSATIEQAGRPQAVEVDVTGRGATTSWRVAMPASWPPAPAAAVVRQATRTFRDLRGVTFEERLASDARHAIQTRWRLEAPDRLAYQIHDGPAGIQIGTRRWDRATGATWEPSQATRLPQPRPQWEGVADARVVGHTSIRGRPAVVVAFFDPQIPAWFRVVIDEKTSRTLDAHMVATAHFMHDVYGPFDGAREITPPQ
jgi:hypothetical protein